MLAGLKLTDKNADKGLRAYLAEMKKNSNKGLNSWNDQVDAFKAGMHCSMLGLCGDKVEGLVKAMGREEEDERIEAQYELALLISVDAHLGVRDKGGKAYIRHPMFVANELMYDLELATIGLLHDVVEDSEYTIDDIKTLGFSCRVVEALVLLTHKKGVPYEVYIEQICSNIDAIRVKRKDLKHNSDINRMKGLRDKDFERQKKYFIAYKKLGEAKRSYSDEYRKAG